MELTPKQQAVELIRKNNNILITTLNNAKGDSIASGLALTSILEKMGKKVTFLLNNESYGNFKFLPGIEKAQKEFLGLRDFVISLSLEKAEVDKISYNSDQGKLNFFISPKEANFTSKDVSFSYGNFKFNVVIVLDSPDLESLGAIHENNADFFYNQPVVNIDHHAGNDYFGAVNMVDLTASSTSEILVSLIESLDPKLMDENIATCLLAGIISDTRSFQNSNTTPKSLTITAQLIAAGANHELVVKNLFKTKPFITLKAWGKVLSSIETDENSKILWSMIGKNDLDGFEIEKEVIDGVMDELLSTAPNINVYLLFLEKENHITVFIRTARHIEADKISHFFGGIGKGQEGEFIIKGEDLLLVKQNALNKIKEYLTQLNQG